MKEETYEKINRKIGNNEFGIRTLRLANSIITKLVYGLYPTLLIVLGFNRDMRLWKVFFVPGISFILLSIFRKKFNAPRPYEVLNITPIIHKESRGNSFPSRHTFSIFIISMAFYYILPVIGIILMGLGTVLAMVRVLGGVHFPRDVIAGGTIGILLGIIGFFII